MWSDSAPLEKLLTKGEVAQLCRVEIRTVDRWVAAGKIRWYRIPSGRLLFRAGDVLLAADRQGKRVAPSGGRSDPSVASLPRRRRSAARSASTTRITPPPRSAR
jgi:excisionase family DNA binding protein